ncbi:MAG: SDR family oxidoreductase [Shimia sp.]|jgi:glucose 1-dehydrogenase|uniref:SDR family oxidoreductase n=1 Tax=Shimia sp. TaxID=1954381 RepID=UPI0025D876F9|nr:SDR family oxidoreductase [Shimia sp.]MCH2066207.1 SDR family oxidoreductase [Shimia sp.]
MSKVLLITGASAGIGAATAKLAAEAGYDLALNYRSDTQGAETVAESARALGIRAELFQADVADPDQVEAMFKAIDASFGRVDALANNAGIVDQGAPVTEFTHARLKRMFDVNVIGAMLVAKEAVIRMQAQGGGAIVNVSSVASRTGSANEYVDYAASKAAIDTFTKGLADEVAAQGIRVNSLRPGITDTEIHAKGGAPDRAKLLAHKIPMQRPGTSEEIARAILFLLSEDASYITGSTLDVSGGR